VFEYDYYLDQNDPDERMKMQQAMMEAGMMIEKYSAKTELSHGYVTCFARGSAGRKVISMQEPGLIYNRNEKMG